MTDRRQFLQAAVGSSAFLAMGSPPPYGWLQAAAAQSINPRGGRGGDRVLVVIQLTGGNDGMNTVVPFGIDEYYRQRFTLAQSARVVHRLDDQVGLHPAMSGLNELFQEGLMSVVQGVGYPNPNRSHFESMDLWHSAHLKTSQISTGWLGRYLDQLNETTDVPAVHLGSEDQPLALAAEDVAVPTMRSVEAFRLEGRNDQKLSETITRALTLPPESTNPLLDHIRASSLSAVTTSQRVEEAVGGYDSSFQYPYTNLGRKLRGISQLINAGLGTRVYYVTLDGFDTHSNQGDAHAGLLGELSGALTAFTRDLQRQHQLSRVMTMVFSEFGRRVKENASRGTDHGAAAPMFLSGGNLRGGLVGEHPSLADLDDGDLKFKIDYRSVYATILEGWLEIDSEPILGKSFEKLSLLTES